MSLERRRARCDVTHRRGFLVASAALGAALLVPAGASAAQVKVLQGGVRVNGKKASKSTAIRPGDTVETAAGASVAFVIGEDAFLLRGESKLMLEHNASGKALAISGLRLLSGALLAVFSPGARRIETPTATAGIRGTGVYLEASAEQTYFCTCYGVVELRDRAGVERKTVVSGYHTPNLIFANPAERGKMADAEVKNHTDEELVMLERLVGRTSPIVLRNQKLKEAATPEMVEQPKPAPEQKAAESKPPPPEEKTAREQSTPTKDAAPEPAVETKSPPRPPQEDITPIEAPKAAREEVAEPPPKPLSKKARKQKQSKAKAKPAPETPPPAEPAPMPEKADSPELGPSPMPPPAQPQPPAQEWRLPPPRLE